MPKIDTGFKYREKTGDNLIAWVTNLVAYSSDEPLVLDWWQAHYLRSEDDFLIANKSRRIGWSWVTAVKGLGKALDPALSAYTKQFVSYSLDDATEKIKIAAEFYDSIPEISRPKKLISRTQTRLEFLDRNGRSVSRLISLPCKQPRGKGGDISLDEYAFHAKDDEIYTAAIAVTSRVGKIEIGSTPFGNKGRFYEIMTDARQYQHYKRYSIPWWMCPVLCRNGKDTVRAALRDKNLTTEQRVRKYGSLKIIAIFESMPLEDFQQEYECLYRDEMAAFITLDMIQACTPTGDDELLHYKTLDEFILAYDPAIHGSLYAGYDVGRTNDRGELKILGHYPDGSRTLWCKESMKAKEFELQEDLLTRAISRLPVHRMAIDGTGLGMDLGERMTKKFKRKVESCMFTNEFKESIANALWLEMNTKNITLPADRGLQTQIHSIKKIVTSGKHARFDCDNNAKHHADEFWALALANYAIGTGEGRSKGGFYEQVAQRRSVGTVKITNPNAVLNRIARAYQRKV